MFLRTYSGIHYKTLNKIMYLTATLQTWTHYVAENTNMMNFCLQGTIKNSLVVTYCLLKWETIYILHLVSYFS